MNTCNNIQHTGAILSLDAVSGKIIQDIFARLFFTLKTTAVKSAEQVHEQQQYFQYHFQFSMWNAVYSNKPADAIADLVYANSFDLQFSVNSRSGFLHTRCWWQTNFFLDYSALFLNDSFFSW